MYSLHVEEGYDNDWGIDYKSYHIMIHNKDHIVCTREMLTVRDDSYKNFDSISDRTFDIINVLDLDTLEKSEYCFEKYSCVTYSDGRLKWGGCEIPINNSNFRVILWEIIFEIEKTFRIVNNRRRDRLFHKEIDEYILFQINNNDEISYTCKKRQYNNKYTIKINKSKKNEDLIYLIKFISDIYYRIDRVEDFKDSINYKFYGSDLDIPEYSSFDSLKRRAKAENKAMLEYILNPDNNCDAYLQVMERLNSHKNE